MTTPSTTELSIDLSRLENVQHKGDKTEAACPACRAMERDKKGNHLIIWPDGRFGCVAYPGDETHRKEIFSLVGQKEAGPAERPKPKKPAKPSQVWPDAKTAARDITPQGYELACVNVYGDIGATLEYRTDTDKTFRQLRKTVRGWELGAPSCKWSLYGEIPEAGRVYIVEGEKCADEMNRLGLPCVTSAGGSGAADKTDWAPLAGRDVTILPDNDKPGMKYADTVRGILANLASPARCRIVELPDLPEAGDVVDFLDARDSIDPGILRAEIEKLADVAPEVEAPAKQDRRAETSATNGHKGGRPPVTKEVADGFIESQGNPFPIRRHWGQWYSYNGRQYESLSADDLHGRVMSYLRNNRPEFVTRNMVQNVAENLQAADVAGVESRFPMPCWMPSGADAAGWMSMRNCLVNVSTLAQRQAGGTFADVEVRRPHTHELFSTLGLDYDYNPEATCPKWIEYLNGVQPEEQMRDILQMLAGLCLIPLTEFEVFFILFGAPGCGKTVFLYVLELLVGSSNVCCLPLSKFGEKHSTHLLTENLLNIVGDLPTNDGRSSLYAIEGILKDVTSGGLLSCEKKNQQPYETHAIARCIFATNSLPTFADRTAGVWDRLRVIPFDVRFRGTDKQNPRLKEEIVESELPGVFNWAVQGLAKLQALKQFPRGVRGEAIEAKHRADCDHEGQFLLERYEARRGAFTATSGIYAAYRSFCTESGYRSKNLANFSNDIRRVFPDVLDERQRTDAGRERGFLNLETIFDGEIR